ncbi:hypothetical protein VCHC55A1_0221, partial [Vibrio cholerae HC-55A1]
MHQPIGNRVALR